MSKNTFRQIANLVSVILALTVNILASVLPLNGQNTGEISDRFQVYFVPAGYVFAIWGIIYIFWIAFTSYQFRGDQKESPRQQRLGYFFALSGVLNAAWLFTWHYNYFGLGVIVMLALLGTLIAGYLRLDVNRVPVSRGEWWSVDLMVSVYLGWISVATIANVTDWLYFVGWTGFGIAPQTWAIIMLAVASVVGLGMALTRRDVGYLSVFVWAFAGVAVKQVSAPGVVSAAWVATGVALALAVFSLARPIPVRSN